MALTRIVELESGTISIDGEDISKLELEKLRDAMTMIPQDPCLFTGTLRHNVDPFEEHEDEEIISLFKKAGLEYLFEGKSSKEKEEEEAEKADKKKRLQLDDDEEEKKDDDKKKDEDKKDSDKKDGDKKDGDKKDGDKKDDEKDEDDGKGLKFKVKEEGNNLSVGEK